MLLQEKLLIAYFHSCKYSIIQLSIEYILVADTTKYGLAGLRFGLYSKEKAGLDHSKSSQ